MTATRAPGQMLLFDADDTLWENSVYFEEAITAFISYLDHRVHSRAEVREHLNICEQATIAQFGYGLKSFHRSLLRCFEQLAEPPLTMEKQSRIAAFVESIADREIELLPTVEPTLRSLAQRHRLLLVTKGDPEEQRTKLHRSGLASLFVAVEVPEEKNEIMYRDLLHRYRADPATTWMIGNSPRSDINPALRAGMNAVFIPHDLTSVLEHEVLESAPKDQTFLELAAFADLLQHF